MTRSYAVDCVTYLLESGTLRRWERWMLCRLRERLISEVAA